MHWISPFVSTSALLSVVTGYSVLRDYSGQDFYSEWDFFGSFDNLTLGDVWWLNREDAFSQKLAYVNEANHAIIKVDNSSIVPFNEKRGSIRITTKDAYTVGSLWIADIIHVPYGCAVWPAFWTKGPLWPDDGEIDILEAINLMQNNQMALHTLLGCTHTTPSNQKGQSQELNCSTEAGCTVEETMPNSYQKGFNDVGGGVWATQFDVAGIFIWFWSRPNIPPSITQANSTSPMNVSDWGSPSASYPSDTCNITQFFTPQNLVLDITLCGKWAGLGAVYNSSCGKSGPTGLCYNDNVVGPGSPRFDNAYFEIEYVRAYTTEAPVPSGTALPDSAVGPTSSETTTRGVSGTRRPEVAGWFALGIVVVVWVGS